MNREKKALVVAAIAIVFSAGVCYVRAVQAPLAFGVLADSANTANTVVYRDATNNSALGSVTFAGPATLQSKTLAQLILITPVAGDQYYCSNCSPAKVVVATGTAVSNFADAVGAVFK